MLLSSDRRFLSKGVALLKMTDDHSAARGKTSGRYVTVIPYEKSDPYGCQCMKKKAKKFGTRRTEYRNCPFYFNARDETI